MKKPHVQSNARVGDLNIMQNWINSKLSMRGVYCICVCVDSIFATISVCRQIKQCITSIPLAQHGKLKVYLHLSHLEQLFGLVNYI